MGRRTCLYQIATSSRGDSSIYKQDGYVADFDIPIEWWQTTQTLETERKRAERRHAVRRYANMVWKNLKQNNSAWRVERFVVVVGIAYPEPKLQNAVHAAETVKPIIDAGTTQGLWPDDDANHRHATIYFQLPEISNPGQFHIKLYVFPIPRSYHVTDGLTSSSLHAWQQENKRTLRDYAVTFAIPRQLWMTSNLTDTNMVERRSNGHISQSWGDGRSLGIRNRVAHLLTDLAEHTFIDQGFTPVDRFMAVACVQYPRHNDSDPDNAAETIAQILQAGSQVGAWPNANSRHCHAVAFCKADGRCPDGYHIVQLHIIPVPDNYHVAVGIASTASTSWTCLSKHKAMDFLGDSENG